MPIASEPIYIAINDSGIAIAGIAEPSASIPHIALISPSGVATQISDEKKEHPEHVIESIPQVVTRETLIEFLEVIVPTSFGSGSLSYSNGLFALSSQILSNHLSTLTISSDRAIHQRELPYWGMAL